MPSIFRPQCYFDICFNYEYSYIRSLLKTAAKMSLALENMYTWQLLLQRPFGIWIQHFSETERWIISNQSAFLLRFMANSCIQHMQYVPSGEETRVAKWWFPKNISKDKKKRNSFLTRWGRVTHICVSKLTIIGSDNGLSPGRRQAIIWTNDGILLIGPLGTNFSEIVIGIRTFSLRKMHVKCRLRNGVHFFSASMC